MALPTCNGSQKDSTEFLPVQFVAITNQRCVSWPRKKSWGRNGWIVHGGRIQKKEPPWGTGAGEPRPELSSRMRPVHRGRWPVHRGCGARWPRHGDWIQKEEPPWGTLSFSLSLCLSLVLPLSHSPSLLLPLSVSLSPPPSLYIVSIEV